LSLWAYFGYFQENDAYCGAFMAIIATFACSALLLAKVGLATFRRI
jgi:hypothetical protein